MDISLEFFCADQMFVDLFLFAQLVFPLDSGIRSNAVVKHKVPQNPGPGSVLGEAVVILCCDLFDLPTKETPGDEAGSFIFFKFKMLNLSDDFTFYQKM